MASLRLRLPQAETARPRLFQELLNPEFPENKKGSELSPGTLIGGVRGIRHLTTLNHCNH